ncbi:hypothetical protein WMY93_026340 [Mugilogobius chulae]|uniref:C2 domain-containing protein n=1 Tax=Mugilogobius chulae TaxID=88201 RepID=A0AAW0MYS0_9GOBI
MLELSDFLLVVGGISTLFGRISLIGLAHTNQEINDWQVSPFNTADVSPGSALRPLRLRPSPSLPVRAEYQSESSPESSSDSGAESLGQLSLTVDYNFPKKALVVTVVGARGLPAVSQGSSDPYVKLTILPEKKHRVKTRVLRRTTEPLFDETFSFYGLSYSALPELTLHFLVLSFDRFARDDVIGEALVPLKGVDPSTGRVHLTQELSRRSTQSSGCGELLTSLCYQPVSHRLSVVVLKAKHLPKMDASLSANPYVKVNVYYGRKRIAKKKTHVKKSTLNPVFNESFIYDIPPDLLPQISLELLVLDFDRTTKNQVLGRVHMGLSSPCATGAAHWSEVCQSPRRQISKWHSLAPF